MFKLAVGTSGTLSFTTRCVNALTLIARSVRKLKEEKIQVLGSFQVKYLMEDDPIYLGELALNLLSHRDHFLSSSQNISTHLGFHCPIKEILMDHVRRDQE